MKRWLVLLMLLIQAVFAVGAEAAIQVPPKPSVSSGIYVQDYAGVLSPQTRQALNAIGQDLDNKNHRTGRRSYGEKHLTASPLTNMD